MNIGIIGTAGRKEDAPRLNAELYLRMKTLVKQIISHYSANHSFVSGGAAYADHLAVQLYLETPGSQLHLHIPSNWDSTFCQFQDNGDVNYITNPGGTANYYHRLFEAKTKIKSLEEIQSAINKGATVTCTPGFKHRNSKVASQVDMLVALTFGSGNLVKDGGTADTMEKFLKRNFGISWHIDLNTMTSYTPAKT